MKPALRERSVEKPLQIKNVRQAPAQERAAPGGRQLFTPRRLAAPTVLIRAAKDGDRSGCAGAAARWGFHKLILMNGVSSVRAGFTCTQKDPPGAP